MKSHAASSVESAPTPISQMSSSVAVPPERRSTSSPLLGLDQLGRAVLARMLVSHR